MPRLERPQAGGQNPAKKFIEWKSEEKCFSFYDKEKKENVLIQLPFKILFLEHYHTVKGWSDKHQSAIYSNEVYGISKEELTVKSFKGGLICKGYYKDNKEVINNAGGRYHRSIYGMLENGEIVNISLKGAAVKSYSDFYNDCWGLLDNQFIEINSFKEEKKGRVNYSVPIFEVGKHITDEVDSLANKSASILENYINNYKNVEQKNVEQEDEVPF